MTQYPLHYTIIFFLAALASGCASAGIRQTAAGGRDFNFAEDTFAYVNELDWEYRNDPATGQMVRSQNLTRPEFVHRCFAVSHMARKFFQYAQFDPSSPMADEAFYRKAVAEVVSRSPAEAERLGKVVIPGYANLHSFSREHEKMLKEASGSPLHSYFQLSNWRMVFPFSRDHQQATALKLQAELAMHQPPIVHLIRFDPFPVTMIDHVVVIVAAEQTPTETRFSVYDPNNSNTLVPLTFDHASRTFIFPATNYFNDGPINLYEIYGDELN